MRHQPIRHHVVTSIDRARRLLRLTAKGPNSPAVLAAFMDCVDKYNSCWVPDATFNACPYAGRYEFRAVISGDLDDLEELDRRLHSIELQTELETITTKLSFFSPGRHTLDIDLLAVDRRSIVAGVSRFCAAPKQKAVRDSTDCGDIIKLTAMTSNQDVPDSNFTPQSLPLAARS